MTKVRNDATVKQLAAVVGNYSLFMARLAQGMSIQAACVAAGITRYEAQVMRATDASFAQAWDEAVAAGVDALEDFAVSYATKGIPITYTNKYGKEKTIHRPSEYILKFLLQHRRREIYNRRPALELTGLDGGPIEINHSNAERAELLTAFLAKQKEKP